MKEGPNIAYIAALIGDPARANMLTALMSGKALTVSELAHEAGVTLQTASAHLSKLQEAELLLPRKQGRHKYFSLNGPEVARVLEGLMGLAAGAGYLRKRTGPKDHKLRKARVCYNHLAGDMGTQMFDSLMEQGHLGLEQERLFLTESGAAFVEGFGIDLKSLQVKSSPLCLECLDWSERRSHLAGSLGRALMSQFEALSWAKRDAKTRVVTFTPIGTTRFEQMFRRL